MSDINMPTAFKDLKRKLNENVLWDPDVAVKVGILDGGWMIKYYKTGKRWKESSAKLGDIFYFYEIRVQPFVLNGKGHWLVR